MGLNIPNSLCPICEDKEENSHHLFFDCKVAAFFWGKLGRWWNFTLPNFQRIEDHFIWSWHTTKNKKEGLWIQVAIIAVLVSIWKLRNGVIFDKKKIEEDIEFRKTQEMTYFWLFSRNSKFKMELVNWISNPKNSI